MWPVTPIWQCRLSEVFGWDSEKFQQKYVPSYPSFSCGDHLKFLMGLRKVSTKRCDQLHGFNAVETNLSFWWDLESFDKKLWPVAPFWQYRLSQVFDGTWKNFDKKVRPVTHFFRSADYLKFLMGFRKISTKMCAQLHVFSLWRLTWVFDGTWKVSTKSCDQLHLFGSTDYRKFLMGLGKISTKRCDQSHIFFAVQTILSFWWGSEKFPQKCVPSYTFFRCGD